MSTGGLRRQPPPGFEKVGDGEHSEVWRRPGSRFCLQLFRTDCPELTPEKVRREYVYLRRTYASIPGLVPLQRLFLPGPRAHISDTRLVKAWVEVDSSLPLNRVRRHAMSPLSAAQMERFLFLTRGLLYAARHEPTLLPDIIDERFQNLAVDTGGRLRLLDTNRLINTHALRDLAPDETLDITERWIHARWLRRLMYLEAAFTGRSRTELRSDPLYRRYLSPDSFDALFASSCQDGEEL
ncbi:hypothetical protein [Streptomyces nanshensis]|uniref:Uncharacterized protein n=1 Tax=Streptomyces nanshensis TaxID=518642 RepID=A0A1E7KZF8_9ACTN|nr:hypothetical protein [Streptomyces nanshensis]OEV09316.1 hypothetical protein AN218_23060 [Streptomyces nanshensis]